MAGFVWWSGVIAVCLLTCWEIAADVYLYRTGASMITDYLRRHPWAFWSGAIAMTTGLVSLAVHLFIRAMISDNPPLP